jgi:hydroxyethylthiazole kinase
MLNETNALLKSIKTTRPLIVNLTNYVTMDFVANGLLSLGASPVMCHAREEIEDLMKLAAVLVINLGTLGPDFISLCKKACTVANHLNVPIVLDPVGAGASQYRTDINLSLIETFKIAIIRGNASEIMALAKISETTKGVDSSIENTAVINPAKILSKQTNAAIVISGKTDIVIDDHLSIGLDRGSALMPSITGTGCLLTAIIAAFLALEKNRFEAAKLATLFYGICGEIAQKKSSGPGSFKTNFLDALSTFIERGDYERH